MKWWQHDLVKLHRRKDCWHCMAPLQDEHFILFDRLGRTISAVQVCKGCEAFEASLLECLAEQRRVTQITISERCLCGNAIPYALDECIRCHRERKYLDKRLAEVKFALRLAKQMQKFANSTAHS